MSGFGSFLAGALNSMTSLINTGYVNDANISLAGLQNQWNLEQWQRQTAYNDPVNQVSRLSAAGINPALAMSQSGLVDAGNASLPAAAASPHPMVPFTPQFGFPDPFELEQVRAQTKLAESQAAKNDAEANQINEMLPGAVKEQTAKIDEIKQSISNMQSQVDLMHAQMKNLSQQDTESLFRILHQRAQETFEEMRLEKEFKEFHEFCKRNSAEIAKMYSAIGVDKATVRNLNSLTDINDQSFAEMVNTMAERMRGIRLSNIEAEERINLLGFNLDKLTFDNPLMNGYDRTSKFGRVLIDYSRFGSQLLDGILKPFKGLIPFTSFNK